jgi:hypothetical protein
LTLIRHVEILKSKQVTELAGHQGKPPMLSFLLSWDFWIATFWMCMKSPAFWKSILCTFIYGSFAEWGLHKKIMHNPRWKRAYSRHVLDHHLRDCGESFVTPHATYSIGESSLIPLMWFAHAPVYFLVGYFNAAAGWGTAFGALAYLVIYEVHHFLQHARPDCWLERFRIFRWLRKLHHIHHEDMTHNFNVVLPLADAALGTLSLVFPSREKRPR